VGEENESYYALRFVKWFRLSKSPIIVYQFDRIFYLTRAKEFKNQWKLSDVTLALVFSLINPATPSARPPRVVSDFPAPAASRHVVLSFPAPSLKLL
jgi:hypothetical protein